MKVGDEVVIAIVSDVTDHAHLHGYDVFADVAPGKPAVMRFTAHIPGVFELELEELGKELARVQVQ